MAKMESTVRIARPVAEVFGFFIDLDKNAPRTDPNVESVVKTPEGPTRPGTTFHFRQKALGKVRESTTTFTALETNRKIEMEAILGPLRPKGTITFDPANGGTIVVVRLSPNPVGALKLLAPIFGRIGQKAWDKRLAGLKAALESSAPGAAAYGPAGAGGPPGLDGPAGAGGPPALDGPSGP